MLKDIIIFMLTVIQTHLRTMYQQVPPSLFFQDAYSYVEHHTNSLLQSGKLLKATAADKVTKQVCRVKNRQQMFE